MKPPAACLRTQEPARRLTRMEPPGSRRRPRQVARALPLDTRGKGFTLVELLIVIVILSALAAIALSSYREMVRRGDRRDAQAVLMETSQYMERYFTNNNTFTGALVLSNFSPKGATGTRIKYNITLVTTAGPPSTYVVQAVPQNGQVGDTCGTLTISNTGATTDTGAGAPATPGCW